MPASFPPSAGGFAMLGAVVGPAMMLALAFSQPGPVRTLLKAGADRPEGARRAGSLGIREVVLEPLIRSGVVVREKDGCVWVVRDLAKRRQRRIAVRLALATFVLMAAVWAMLSIGGPPRP